MFRLQLSVADCELRTWKLSDAKSLARHANNRQVWLNLRDASGMQLKGDGYGRWIGRIRSDLFLAAVNGTPGGEYTLSIESDVNLDEE
jgi:hypothetical protein